MNNQRPPACQNRCQVAQETNMPNVTETKTPYGIIFRTGDREWFLGSVEEYRTAKAWEAYRKPLDTLKSL
jgi:hypothetical protein